MQISLHIEEKDDYTKKKDNMRRDSNYNKCFIEKYKPTKISDTVYNDEFKHVLYGLIEMHFLNILLKGERSSGKSVLIDCLIYDYYKEFIVDKSTYNSRNDENIWYFNCLNEQGINGFRMSLKHFCQTRCSYNGKKKLIILDDIDTLNEQNQQIIRSNLDKYSSNICFISSCSNLNKVIDSLQSRLHILKVPVINAQHMTSIYNKVVIHEGINLDTKSRDFMIRTSDYSINVMLNNLKKITLLSKKTVKYDDVINVCSQICFDYYDSFCLNIMNSNVKNSIEVMYNLHNQGYSFIDILENFVTYIKYTTLLDEQKKLIIMKYLCKYINLSYSFNDETTDIVFFTYDIRKCLLGL